MGITFFDLVGRAAETMGGRNCLVSAAGGKLRPTLSERIAGIRERVEETNQRIFIANVLKD